MSPSLENISRKSWNCATPGNFLFAASSPRRIDIAEADELHARMRPDVAEIRKALPVRADHADLEFAIRIGAAHHGGKRDRSE